MVKKNKNWCIYSLVCIYIQGNTNWFGVERKEKERVRQIKFKQTEKG